MAAADALWKSCRESCLPDGEPIHPENVDLDDPATMLYGYAVETAIKACLIKKFGSYDRAEKTAGTAWSHNLPVLARLTGLTVTKDQLLLLETLRAFALWAGRYPISKKQECYILPKQLNAAANMTPCRMQSCDKALLEPFMKDLRDYVWGKAIRGDPFNVPAEQL